MYYKKILFFSLLFLSHAVHPMKQRGALSKGFFARNAQSSLFLNQKNTPGPIASRIYRSTQKGNLSRIHFRQKHEHTNSLPFIIGIGLGYGISSSKISKVYADDETQTDEIGIDEILAKTKDNTLEFYLLESPKKEKYQKAVLDNYLNIICRDSFGRENYNERESFYKILINYLKTIKDEDNSFLHAITRSLKENLKSNTECFGFQKIIKTIIKNHPSYAEALLTKDFENTTLTTIRRKIPAYILESAIKRIPSIACIIKNHLIQCFLTPQEDVSWYRLTGLFTACIKANPSSAQEFALALAHFIEKTERIGDVKLKEGFLTIFQIINSAAPCNKELESVLPKKRLESTSLFDATVLQELLYSDSCTSSCIADTIPKTSTTNHLKKHAHKGDPNIYHKFIKNKDLSQLAHKIIQQEDKLQETHYTFIHAQSNYYLLAEQLHTFFEFNKHKRPFKNAQFLDLRVKKRSDDLEQAKKYHEQLIKHGCKGTAEEKSVLFMNKSLFGNISRSWAGECSAEFISNNRNVGFIKLKLKDIFKIHGHSDLYDKYKTRLRVLHQEFMKELPNLGTSILIAIPKVDVNKYIFSAHPYGRKKKITIIDKEKTYQTDNVQHILETLENDSSKVQDSDHLIFCLPMTTYSGLNPESGIRMYPFTAGNPSQLDAWYTQLYNLFDEIEADIKSRN